MQKADLATRVAIEVERKTLCMGFPSHPHIHNGGETRHKAHTFEQIHPKSKDAPSFPCPCIPQSSLARYPLYQKESFPLIQNAIPDKGRYLCKGIM